ncbi:MAG: tetratricopeptide repeat protein [Planctomycetaceae bacterium]|nr:tetratricopeptide repeat protein [Planctomycetaceae bacterium]
MSQQRPSTCRLGASLAFLMLVVVLMLARPIAAADIAEARALVSQGDYEAALQTASDAIAANTYGEDWWLLKAEMEQTLGRYSDAKTTLEGALAKYQWSIRIRARLRDAARFSGDATLAAAQVPAILEQVKASAWRYSDAESLLTLGGVSLELGVDAKTVQDAFFRRAQRNYPRNAGGALALGGLALTKRDFALAAETFQAAVQTFPQEPAAHYGLARALDSSDREAALAALNRALEINGRHIPSLLLLAEDHFDAEHYDEAKGTLQQVLDINPVHPLALALLSTIAHLQNDSAGETELRTRALSTWDANPEVDHLIGLNLSHKYRFAEGAAHQRLALQFDADYWPAKKQLAEDLLRLGEEAEGWQLADEAFQRDGYDVALFNLVTLRDELEKFRTLEDEQFVVRMEATEAAIYGERVRSLLHEARDVLCTKYGLQLDGRTTVEIFPNPDDFAVRTFGLPGAGGYLGVCFGDVITANSPAAVLIPTNWESVLWHEYTHVVTLNLTANKMPRWLSEGISVYEERQRNPAWGEKMNPAYRRMIAEGHVTPIRDLSGAFLAPESPLHLMFAYYESSLVVEHIVAIYGFESLKLVLADLREGITINDALERRVAPLDDLQVGFDASVQEQLAAYAPGADWSDPFEMLSPSASPEAWRDWIKANPGNVAALTTYAQMLINGRQLDEARDILKQAVKLNPTAGGPDSAARLLATVYRQLGDTANERELLLHCVQHDSGAFDASLRLIELATEAGDWQAVHGHAVQALAVNPLVPQPHRALADSAEQLNLPDEAIAALRSLLVLPHDNAAELHFRLARLLAAQGDSIEARRQVLMALEQAPRYRDAQALLLTLVRSNTAMEEKE